MKTHGLPKHRCIWYFLENFEWTVVRVKENVAGAIGVDAEEISSKTNSETPSSEIWNKAADLNKLNEQIKKKLPQADKRWKIQMLTLTPESWSVKYALKYFSFSECLVRKARKLQKEKGILSLPAQKIWKILSAETSERVKALFWNDQYSCLLPGKKDVVIIGKNVYQQKRRWIYLTFLWIV